MNNSLFYVNLILVKLDFLVWLFFSLSKLFIYFKIGTIPLRGCEVFVGKLPRDCYEDELVPVFEKVGKIYELRLMMDYNGQNRGYAFVVYCSKRDAQKCVRTLNNYEIRKGRLLGVCQSVDNCRLFIGGIPKKVKKDDIMEEISKVGILFFIFLLYFLLHFFYFIWSDYFIVDIQYLHVVVIKRDRKKFVSFF